MRSLKVALLLLSLTLAAGAADAASPEEAYLAARGDHIERLKRLDSGKPADGVVQTADEKALKDLEKRLREIVGDVTVKGFPAQGKIHLETLVDAGYGFDLLDALVFSTGDAAPRLIVTTDGLLDHWLRTQADWWKKQSKTPPGAETALRSEEFFSQAISSDAALSKCAVLPIAKPANAAFAFAMLGGRAQDIGPNPANELIVATRRDGKVFIASVTPKAKIAKIPACERVWTESERKADKAYAAYKAKGAEDEKMFDEYTCIRTQGDAAFHACFVERAPREAFFAPLTQEAQALADRLASP